jgi:lysophospholipase L1-like esterase
MPLRAAVRRPTRVLTILLACTLLSVVVVTGQSAAAAVLPASLHILVMGDSYSAGNGAGSYYGAKTCYRSRANYAELFAKAARSAPYNRPTEPVRNVACSGAVTADFAKAKDGRPPQIEAVQQTDDIIFLTVGGNDAYFLDIVKFCLIAKTRDGANCNQNLTRAESLVSNGTLANRITSVLHSITSKANSQAKIVLLGYPFLEGDVGYTLRSGHGAKAPIIAVGKRLRALNVAADKIDGDVVAAANKANGSSQFIFASTQSLFSGPPYHGLYAQQNNPRRWMVQPFVDASIATKDTWYHPNPTGWSAEAKLLQAALLDSGPTIVATLPSGVIGQPYSADLTTVDHRSGTWSVTSGLLPPGLKLSGYTISGTPTSAGNSTFAVKFVDTDGRSAVGTISLTVAAGPSDTSSYDRAITFSSPSLGSLSSASVSDDASRIAYEAPNLGTQLVDTATGVSQQISTQGASGWLGVVSGNGRYLTFAARTPDYNGDTALHLYQRDLLSGSDVRVSPVYSDGGGTSMYDSVGSAESMQSADGRYVAYQTGQAIPGGAQYFWWIRDMNSGSTVMSVSPSGAAIPSAEAKFSANGRYLAFRGLSGDSYDAVYLWDLQAGVAKLVGPTPDLVAASEPFNVTNEGKVTYQGTNPDYTFGGLYQYDSATGLTTKYDGSYGFFGVSPNGRYVAVVDSGCILGQVLPIYVKDKTTDTRLLVDNVPCQAGIGKAFITDLGHVVFLPWRPDTANGILSLYRRH